jgi:hypothetical protein
MSALLLVSAALILSTPNNVERMAQATTALLSTAAGDSQTTNTYTIVETGESYAVIEEEILTMNGSSDAAARVREIAGKRHGNYIWFEREGKPFVIDDPKLVKQAKDIVRPQLDLGRKQAEIGEQQARLGQEQARLGQLQSKEGNPDVFKELSSIQSELKQLRSQNQDLTQDERARIQSRITALENRLTQMKSPATSQQAKLAEQQSKLAEQQSELSDRQTKLSEAATRQISIVIDTALKTEKAKAIQ